MWACVLGATRDGVVFVYVYHVRRRTSESRGLDRSARRVEKANDDDDSNNNNHDDDDDKTRETWTFRRVYSVYNNIMLYEDRRTRLIIYVCGIYICIIVLLLPQQNHIPVGNVIIAEFICTKENMLSRTHIHIHTHTQM